MELSRSGTSGKFQHPLSPHLRKVHRAVTEAPICIAIMTMRLQVRPSPDHSDTINHAVISVNDVVVHPNQGELISCDQAGRIKQWDLSENICTHELVRSIYICRAPSAVHLKVSRHLLVILPCARSVLLPMVLAWSRGITR